MGKMWTLVLVGLAACALPQPLWLKSGPPAPPDRASDRSQKAVFRSALRQYYPQLLRHASGRPQTVLFVVTSNGRIERTDLSSTTPRPGSEVELLYKRFPDLRDDPLRRQDGVTRFEAGESGRDPIVVVWVERDATALKPGPFRLQAAAPTR